MDILEKLGVVIRLRRHELGLSQEDLAAEAGELDRSYLSEIENGQKNISVQVLVRLAEALKIAPDVLLSRALKK